MAGSLSSWYKRRIVPAIFMDKILTPNDISKVSSIPQSPDIVLAGGCFDLLHQGHLSFLQSAKGQGTLLIILLESDEMIKKRKGEARPIQTQNERAHQLATIKDVDYIILLRPQMEDSDYDKLVSEIKPAIIATTKGDPYRHHKERQAQIVNAEVIDVIERLPQYSTTNSIKHYENK